MSHISMAYVPIKECGALSPFITTLKSFQGALQQEARSFANFRRPEAVLPGRALCLPTFSHFLIVNEISFSLSPLSLSLSLSLGPLLHRILAVVV
jgi:hypothetical protein